MHELLLGEHGFYDEIFTSLRIPYEPVRWVRDVARTSEGQIDKAARVIELIHAYRVRGHLMADTDPLEFEIRQHPDLDVLQHGLTLWDLDRTFPVGGFAGKQKMKLRDVLGVLRDSYCRRVGIEYMHIQDPEERRWIQDRIETQVHQARPGRAEARPQPAQRGRGVRDLPADQVRRPEAVLAGGRRVADPAARRGAAGLRRGAASTRSSSAWPTAAGSTCWPTSSASRTRRSSPSSRVTSTRSRAHGSGDVKYHLGQTGKFTTPDGEHATTVSRGRQPVPPGGGRPGAGGHRPGQAGPARPGPARLHGAAAAGARRRRVRRPGRGRRDAEPLPAARLPHRRHGARGRQQPGRLHHRPGVQPLVALLAPTWPG